MSDLMTAMAMLIGIFEKYAGAEGKKDTLTKNEVKTLLEKELPGMLQGAKSPGEVDKLMKSLDHDGDSEVDFQEFVVLVACVTCSIQKSCGKKK